MDVTIVARLRDEVSADARAIKRSLRGIEQGVQRAGRVANDNKDMFDKVLGGARGVIGGALGALRSLGTVAGTALGAAATAAVGFGLSTAAAMQNAEVAFTTMLGSAEAAGAFLQKLKDFAAATPFEFTELQTAASSLISIGIEADKVVPIMTTLGNVTSGMGTGQEGIKRATVALQQMNAAGKIQAEDLNQLRDAGIPVYDLLAAATDKSKEAIAEMVDKGKLGRKELDLLMEALETGKGLERFNGLMEKQSQTLGGLFSTLKDTVTMGLADALMPVVPLLERAVPRAAEIAQGAFTTLTDVLGRAIKLAPRLWNQLSKGNAAGAATTFTSIVGGGERMQEVMKRVIAAGLDLFTILRRDVLPVVKDVGTVVAAVVVPALGFLAEKIAWAADNGEIVKPILYGVVAALTAMMIISAVTTGFAALVGVMTFLTGPVGLVILAIGILVAAFVRLWNTSEGFRTFVFDFLISFADRALGMAETVLGAFVSAFGWVPGVGDELRTAQENVRVFRDTTNAYLQGLRDKHVNVGVDVQGKWSLSSDPGRAAAVLSTEARRDAARAAGRGRGDGLGMMLGGSVRGRGGPTDDAIPALLSNGEYVVRAEAVKRAGTGFLDWLNAGRFAAGGQVSIGAPGFVTNRDTAGIFGVQKAEEVAGDAVERVAKAAAPKVASALKAMMSGGLGAQPMGVQRMMTALRAVFPGLRLISGLRPGAITATGNPSYHGKGRAVDIPPSMAVFEWIRQNFPNSRELIFSPAGGRQIHNGRSKVYTGITRAMHWDHVHWAMAQGGLVGRMSDAVRRGVAGRLFDAGGWLRRGETAVSNLPSAQREAIMPEDVMVGAIRRELGTGGAGGVVVEQGGITVVVQNPQSEIDIAAAITAGIRDYERERRERR